MVPPHSVSVIIPCYNGEQFLAEAIDSVLAQTHPANEIIVVDDGSSDQTQAIAKRYPQVTYLYQANQGVAGARQTGFQASQSEYLVFLDQDDRLLPHALETGVKTLVEHPHCALAIGLCGRIDANGKPHPTYEPDRPYFQLNYESLLRGHCICTPAPVLFKRSAIEAIGGFNTKLALACDDYDLYLRLAQRFDIYCHNKMIADYRLHGQNQSAVGKSSLFLQTTLQIFQEQYAFVKGKLDLEAAYQDGLAHWSNLYGPYIVYDVVAWSKQKQFKRALITFWLLLRYYPQGLRDYSLELWAKVSQKLRLSQASAT